MKTLFRWAFRLLILLVVLLVAALLLLNTVAREVMEYKLSRRTGLEVKLDAVKVGLLNPRLTVEGVVVYNRPEFGGSPMLTAPELHVEYDRSALWSRQVHLNLLRVNLAQIRIVEDTNGVLNLKALGDRWNQTGDKSRSSSGHSGEDYQFTGIDTLNLTLGTGTFQSLKNPRFDGTLTPHMTNEVYLRVKSFDTILELVLLKCGVNPFGKDTGHADDPVTYWTEKIQGMGRK